MESDHQKRDVPKQLHRKLQDVYETYLRDHRPILFASLGHNVRYEPAEDEQLPEHSFPLFPGFWQHSRNSAFSDMLKTVLSVREREFRRLFGLEFTPNRNT